MIEKNTNKKRRGRPAIGRAHQVNIALRPELLQALDDYAVATGKNRSQIIRYSLKLLLNQKTK